MTDAARFLREFARDRAERVLPTPGGFAALSPTRFRHAYDHNGLWVSEPVDPAALLAAADEVLAGFDHRRVDVDAEDDDLPAAFVAAGYERGDLVVMTQVREPGEDRPPGSGVVELTVDERVAYAELVWATEYGEADPAVRHELASRAHSAVAAADCTFLGVVGADGVVQASADLFVRGDTAQVEEVVTSAAFRGRGHASRLVRAAAELATAAAPDRTVFLVAETDDWPRQLYGRLGFEVTDTLTRWTRVLSAL